MVIRVTLLRSLLLLFSIFLLSVALRWANIGRPLSKHHEFCTAVSLRVIDIWYQDGIAKYNFNPVMNYPGKQNKYINNFASGSGQMVDDEGNYYYVSHPPLAYYVPYLLFKLTQSKPTVTGLQLFHTLFHFLSALGVFMLINFFYGRWPLAFFSAPALAGYLLYLFNAATLWFQSNTYMSDMLVQVFFIYGILFLFLYVRSQKIKWLAALTVITFLMIYTTWLGLFFSFVVFIVSIYKWRNCKALALVMPLAVVTALGLIFYQYSLINGWEAYWAEMVHRFAVRGHNGVGTFFEQIATIIINYFTSYTSLFLLLGWVLLKLKNTRQLWRLMLETPYMKLFLVVSIIPILLLHLILPNYSGHDFTSLYAALPLCVILALFTISLRSLHESYWIYPVAFVIGFGIGQYFYINRPGKYSLKGNRYAEMLEQGDLMGQKTPVNAVVFLLNAKPTPEMVYYAGRNIQRVNSEGEALEFLREHQLENGVVYQLDDNNKIEILKTITL